MRRTVKALIVFFGVIMVFLSGYKLIEIYLDYKAGDDVYNDVSKEYVEHIEVVIDEGAGGDNLEQETEQEVKERVPVSVDLESLKATNADVAAWLYLEDSKINYPVLHADDNDKYLHTMIDGTYNKAGSIFMDCRNKGDLSDLNIIIYGHNMKNDSMFGTLSEYKKQEYFEDHPVMWLITCDKAYKLEVVAALDTTDDSIAYDILLSADELKEYLEWAIKKSDIATNADVSAISQVVTLSTCYSSNYDNTRYIVIGKMTEFE
ncbi:MAG: class B sortase [Oscillospiraceae bacterium]|nr:class B sortase [Oscillospiraceae bacterium]